MEHSQLDSAFLSAITRSFRSFLECGTSRSTHKLKPLHGAIASDLAMRLGAEYQVKSQGYGEDKEGIISGRYVDKNVDILVSKRASGDVVAGLAVKFVMQNYSQNSNNYFENMLGETANIRAKGYPYFQIFIILDRLPYYKKDKSISRWETFTAHNIEKYVALSQDNIDVYVHTPNKTLVYVVHIPDNDDLGTLNEYIEYYRDLNVEIEKTNIEYAAFGSSVIFNNYEVFMDKVYHTILSV